MSIRKVINISLIISLLALVINVAPATPVAKAFSLGAPANYVPGELLVKFKQGFSLNALFSAKYNLNSSRKITDNLYLLKITSSADPLTLAQTIAGDIAIQYAEPNYIYSLQTNDPNFNLQWNINNQGGFGGVIDADMDADDAWQTYGSGKSFNIAVIDTGAQTDHPDLGNSIVGGYNFLNLSSNYADDEGHGTNIAGIIAAVPNNNLGIAGINSQAKITALKTFDKNGYGSEANIIIAILYAKLAGFKLINASWGNSYNAQGLYDVIKASPEILFVAAAGNKADSQLKVLPLAPNGLNQYNDDDLQGFYPASYDLPNIISVTSSDRFDNLSGNYGPVSVDLAAPGTGIQTTNLANAYISTGGTSLAAAHVTAAASMYWALHPTKSSTEVKLAIVASVDKMPAMVGIVQSQGRLNLKNLLDDNFASAQDHR